MGSFTFAGFFMSGWEAVFDGAGSLLYILSTGRRV